MLARAPRTDAKIQAATRGHGHSHPATMVAKAAAHAALINTAALQAPAAHMLTVLTLKAASAIHVP